ncbi:hypothetical protein CFN79_14300 [Chromobacterium vaccinii]|nr:hypothetical protein CFN79_14300 [Chromobacterium vaccinii]
MKSGLVLVQTVGIRLYHEGRMFIMLERWSFRKGVFSFGVMTVGIINQIQKIVSRSADFQLRLFSQRISLSRHRHSSVFQQRFLIMV